LEAFGERLHEKAHLVWAFLQVALVQDASGFRQKWALRPFFISGAGEQGMAVSKKIETLTAMLAPAVAAVGFELWGVEFFQQGRHSVLRLYIDGPEGVGVDDCAAVSHQVSGVLDVEDPIAGEYTLEVSSPGWDRPLFTLAHSARFVGSEISVRLASPLNGRRKYKGIIQQISDDAVELLVDGVAVPIPFAAIDKGNVEPKFD
jgi:ribosome maturation factor RimP